MFARTRYKRNNAQCWLVWKCKADRLRILGNCMYNIGLMMCSMNIIDLYNKLLNLPRYFHFPDKASCFSFLTSPGTLQFLTCSCFDCFPDSNYEDQNIERNLCLNWTFANISDRCYSSLCSCLQVIKYTDDTNLHFKSKTIEELEIKIFLDLC